MKTPIKTLRGDSSTRAPGFPPGDGRIESAPRSMLSAERLCMARSLLRPRLLEAGLISAADFNAGHADGLAGARRRLTEKDLLDQGRCVENLSYMLGFRAGELARRGGADRATGSPAGGGEQDR